MGEVTYRRPDGLFHTFKISGDSPTPDEQARISSILSGQSDQNPTNQPGILSTFGSNVGASIDQMQAGAARIGQGIAEEYGINPFGYTAEDLKKIAEEQEKEAHESEVVTPGFFEAEGPYEKLRSLAGTAGYSALPMAATLGGIATGNPALAGLGVAAGFGGNALLSAEGNVQQQIQEHGKVQNWNRLLAATGGQAIVETASDYVLGGIAGLLKKPLSLIERQAIKKGAEEAFSTIVKQGGKAGALSTLTEGGEEIVQQILQRWQAGQDLTSPEARGEYLENAVVGAILGGTLGGSIGTYGAMQDAKLRTRIKDAAAAAEEERLLTEKRAKNIPIEQARREMQAAAAFDRANAPDPNTEISGLLPEPATRMVAKPPPQTEPKNLGFSEQEYSSALNMMRARGKPFHADAIKKEMKVGRKKATSMFNEMKRRGDATTTGSKGQYLKIPTASQIEDTRQEYSVRPIDDKEPFSLVIGDRDRPIKKRFASARDAEMFANQNKIKNFEIKQNEKPKEYGLFRTQYAKINGREERISRAPVETFSSAQEANEAAKGYDPSFSPETNQQSQNKARQEAIDEGVKKALDKEFGSTSQWHKRLSKVFGTIVGPGRVDARAVSNIVSRDKDGNVQPNQIIEGLTFGSRQKELERVKGGLRVLINGDLFKGNLDEGERVAAHEAIHVLRTLDLLKPKEWDALQKKALNKKVPGKSYTWLDWAIARNGGPQKTDEHIVEEAIAEMFRYHYANPTALDQDSRSLLQKILDLFKKFAGVGKRYDADDVMRAILGGEMASREEGSGGLGPRSEYPGQTQFSKVIVSPIYSNTDRYFSNIKQEKASAQQWLGMINNAQLPKEELKWLGLEDWLKERGAASNSGQIPRGDILDYIRANSIDARIVPHIGREMPPEDRTRLIQLRNYLIGGYRDDVNSAFQDFQEWLSEQAAANGIYSDTAREFKTLREKYGDDIYHPHWTQEGGEDYTEMVFVLPGLEPSFSVPGHYDQAENILVAARFKTRYYEDGRKILFIEEIQSDLHQRGRAHGYILTDEEERAKLEDQINALNGEILDLRDQRRNAAPKMGPEYKELDALIEQKRDLRDKLDDRLQSQIPDAPLRTKWLDYAIKRIVRYAIDEGFDGIAWHGDVDSIALTEHYPDMQSRLEKNKDGKEILQWYNEHPANGQRVTGVVNTYLRDLPNIVNKLFKPYGATVENIIPQQSAEETIDWNDVFRNANDAASFLAYYGPFIGQDRFQKAVQIALSQREWDFNAALDQAKADKETLYDILKRTDEFGSVSATDANGNPLVARNQFIFNDDLKSGVLDTGLPLYSAVNTAIDRAMNSPKFQAWFNNSVVKDMRGRPIVQYHSTKVPTAFSRFRPFSHFGTLAAATDRMAILGNWELMTRRKDFTLLDKIAEKYNIPQSEQDGWWSSLPADSRLEILYQEDPNIFENGRIYPVFLSIQNPLMIMDENGMVDTLDYAEAARNMGAITEDEYLHVRRNADDFHKLMTSKGYDGLKYQNRIEDPGSYSYITFEPVQAKSIYNSGEWSLRNNDIHYSAVNTDSDNFKRWFEGSKIVNEDGSPRRMYHGTNADFDTFDDQNERKTDHGWFGRGFYFTPYFGAAENYAGRHKRVDIPFKWSDIEMDFPPDSTGESPYGVTTMFDRTGGNIMPVYLSIKNPYIWPANKSPFTNQIDADQFTKDLKAQGHDGVIRMGNNGPWEVVAFEKNQIKSVFNGGDWSEDPNILKSSVQTSTVNDPEVETVPDHVPPDRMAIIENRITYANAALGLKKFFGKSPIWGRRLEEGTEAGLIALQDKMLPWAELINRIKANGGFLANEQDPYLRELLFHGQTDAMIEEANTRYYKPLMEAIKALKITKQDVDELARLTEAGENIRPYYNKNPNLFVFDLAMYALHAPERNEFMRERNAKARPNSVAGMFGSGMRDDEAADIINWIESRPYGDKILNENDPTSLRSMFRALISHTNDIRVAYDLNPEFRGTRHDRYTDYAPIRGHIEDVLDADDDVLKFLRTGKGFNVRGFEDFAATGRESQGVGLLANAIAQNQEAIVRGNKNKVGQSVLNLIRTRPRDTFGKMEIIEQRPVKWGLDRKRGVVRRVPDNQFLNDPMVLKVKERDQENPNKIKETYVRFYRDGRKLAPSLTMSASLGNAGVNGFVKVAYMLNRMIAALATSYNPEFMMGNWPRDIEMALFNVGEHPEFKGMRKAILKSVIPSAKAMYQMINDRNLDDPLVKDAIEFRRHGGMTGLMGLRTLEDTINKINSQMAEDTSGSLNKTLKHIKNFGKLLDDWNMAVENSTRLAAYRAFRDRLLAMTDDPANPANIRRAQERAAQMAKDLTVNFNRGGTTKPAINALYLFFNASMQGSMALLNPLMRSKKLRQVAVGVMLMGAMQDLVMSALAGDDDDGRNEYDKIEDWITDHNIIIMDPFGLSERGYFKFPLPYLMNAIYTAGRMSAKAMRGAASPSDAAMKIVGTTVEAINPFGSGGVWANTVAPTFMDPFVDLAANKDFTGAPIAPEGGGFGQVAKADSQLYWNNTSPPYITIADWLHRLTGGDGEYIPGLIEVSPNTLEYWIEFTGGGAARTVERLFDFIVPNTGLPIVSGKGTFYQMLAGEGVAANDIPFIRRLYGNVSDRTDMQVYIQKRDEVMRVLKGIQDAAKSGDSDAYTSLIRNYPDEYRMAVQVRKVETQRRKLATAINKIRQNNRLSKEQKDQMIKTLKERQNDLVDFGNSIMKELQ